VTLHSGCNLSYFINVHTNLANVTVVYVKWLMMGCHMLNKCVHTVNSNISKVNMNIYELMTLLVA